MLQVVWSLKHPQRNSLTNPFSPSRPRALRNTPGQSHLSPTQASVSTASYLSHKAVPSLLHMSPVGLVGQQRPVLYNAELCNRLWPNTLLRSKGEPVLISDSQYQTLSTCCVQGPAVDTALRGPSVLAKETACKPVIAEGWVL